MTAVMHLVSQTVVGLAVCAGLACGLSLMGEKMYQGADADENRLAVGHCRQCGQRVRFAPRQWCTSCRWCGQLTNVDQAAPPKQLLQPVVYFPDAEDERSEVLAASSVLPMGKVALDLPVDRSGL